MLAATLHWTSLLQGQVVLVASDNTSAVAYINKQGGVRSLSLHQEAVSLFDHCILYQIVIRARHIQGKVNLVPDMLSRKDRVFPAEWTVNRKLLRGLFQTWGTPQVDLFATSLNHQLPLYVSPVPDQLAVAVDGLSFSWEGMFLYAFPPIGLLNKVAAKIRQTASLHMLLIAPHWPRSLWFHTRTE